jgi:tripeptide aminopeptidase
VLGADCKVGIAAILVAAEAVRESGLPHRALQLVFTVQEEPGLLGVRHMDLSLIRGTWGVVLDGSGPIGGIVVEAPGQDQVKFTVRGRSAHSGIEPEKGVNAIACAADAISSIKTGRHDGATTSNIGLISGGTAVNIVPDGAVVEGEIRSLETSRLEQERDTMIGAFKSAARRHGCKIVIEVDRTFEQFRLPSDSRPVRYLSAALEKCGFNPSLARSGGGSDANILNRAGFEMAVMQIGLANAHSKDEYILKEDIVAVARVVNKLPFVVLDEGTRVEGS